MVFVATLAALGIAAEHPASAGELLGLGASVSIGSHPPAPPPSVYAPPTVYATPAPAYVPVPLNCYWTRGEPLWNGYRWVEPRVQVCD